jgi:hypothetical protein
MYPFGYLLWMNVAFMTYLTWIVVKFGIQPSISDSFYALRDKYGESSLIPWLFWLFLINISWPLFPLLKFNGFAFFGMAGIILVGATAQYRQGKSTEIPHVVGAVGGIALTFLSIGIVFGGWAWAWLPAYILVLGILNIAKIPNYEWWIEVLAFVMITAGLAVHTSMSFWS